MVSVGFRSGSWHCFGEANIHFQFTPKYRRGVFKDSALRRACEESFRGIARRWGVTILALEFGPDHVHLFLGNCRNYSVAQLARYFKGASSRELRNAHWDRIRRKLWGSSFWSDGYFYESVGSVTSEAIEYYITRQQRKHWLRQTREPVQERKGQLSLRDFQN